MTVSFLVNVSCWRPSHSARRNGRAFSSLAARGGGLPNGVIGAAIREDHAGGNLEVFLQTFVGWNEVDLEIISGLEVHLEQGQIQLLCENAILQIRQNFELALKRKPTNHSGVLRPW